jgi:hypothetical protein
LVPIVETRVRGRAERRILKALHEGRREAHENIVDQATQTANRSILSQKQNDRRLEMSEEQKRLGSLRAVVLMFALVLCVADAGRWPGSPTALGEDTTGEMGRELDSDEAA